jgi:hypothetical protein
LLSFGDHEDLPGCSPAGDFSPANVTSDWLFCILAAPQLDELAAFLSLLLVLVLDSLSSTSRRAMEHGDCR